MSYKIYYGLKMDGNASAMELTSKLMSLREKIDKTFKEEYIKAVGTLAYRILDYKSFLGQEEMQDIIDLLYDYRNLSREHSNLYSLAKDLINRDENPYLESFMNMFDFRCTLKIFALENKVLFIPYFNKKAYYEVLKEELSEYMYFSNSDKPDEYTDEEWTQRFDDWSKAFELNPKGLSFELVDKNKPPLLIDIPDFIESKFEERIEDLIELKFGDLNKIENEEKIKEVSDYREYLKTALPKTYDISKFVNFNLKK